MHPEKRRAESLAMFLRATGLYESVELVNMAVASEAGSSLSKRPSDNRAADPSKGDFSMLFDG